MDTFVTIVVAFVIGLVGWLFFGLIDAWVLHWLLHPIAAFSAFGYWDWFRVSLAVTSTIGSALILHKTTSDIDV